MSKVSTKNFTPTRYVNERNTIANNKRRGAVHASPVPNRRSWNENKYSPRPVTLAPRRSSRSTTPISGTSTPSSTTESISPPPSSVSSVGSRLPPSPYLDQHGLNLQHDQYDLSHLHLNQHHHL